MNPGCLTNCVQVCANSGNLSKHSLISEQNTRRGCETLYKSGTRPSFRWVPHEIDPWKHEALGV